MNRLFSFLANPFGSCDSKKKGKSLEELDKEETKRKKQKEEKEKEGDAKEKEEKEVLPTNPFPYSQKTIFVEKLVRGCWVRGGKNFLVKMDEKDRNMVWMITLESPVHDIFDQICPPFLIIIKQRDGFSLIDQRTGLVKDQLRFPNHQHAYCRLLTSESLSFAVQAANFTKQEHQNNQKGWLAEKTTTFPAPTHGLCVTSLKYKYHLLLQPFGGGGGGEKARALIYRFQRDSCDCGGDEIFKG